MNRAYAEKSTGLFVHTAQGISRNPTLKTPNFAGIHSYPLRKTNIMVKEKNRYIWSNKQRVMVFYPFEPTKIFHFGMMTPTDKIYF